MDNALDGNVPVMIKIAVLVQNTQGIAGNEKQVRLVFLTNAIQKTIKSLQLGLTIRHGVIGVIILDRRIQVDNFDVFLNG